MSTSRLSSLLSSCCYQLLSYCYHVAWECNLAVFGSTMGGTFSRKVAPPIGWDAPIPIAPPAMGRVLRRMFAFTGPARPRPTAPPSKSPSPSPP